MSKHLVWTNDSKAMEEELRKVGGRVSIIFGSSGISAIDLPAGVDVNSLSSASTTLPPMDSATEGRVNRWIASQSKPKEAAPFEGLSWDAFGPEGCPGCYFDDKYK